MALQRVLYLENDPAVRAVTAMILESLNGLTLETCDSLSDLAGKVSSFQPDLILLDSLSPGLADTETLAELCCDTGASPRPLVVITAADRCTDMAHWEQLGVGGVIPKPFDPMALADELRSVCTSFKRDASTDLRVS